jgi:ATP-binding cassette, subfamily C, bacterial LapB
MISRQDPFMEFETGSTPRRFGDEEPAGARPTIQEEGAVDAIPELDAIGVDHDALLHSMVYLTKHHGKERSPDSMLDGMPVDGLLNPDQAVRVMRAAGYNAGLMQRDIRDIHALLLPAILLLRNGDACVLVRRFDTPNGQSPMCEIVMPGPEFHSCRASEAELEQEYLGFALVATPLPEKMAGAAGREQALL